MKGTGTAFAFTASELGPGQPGFFANKIYQSVVLTVLKLVILVIDYGINFYLPARMRKRLPQWFIFVSSGSPKQNRFTVVLAAILHLKSH